MPYRVYTIKKRRAEGKKGSIYYEEYHGDILYSTIVNTMKGMQEGSIYHEGYHRNIQYNI